VPDNSPSLTSRSVIVTGGSKGLGREMALALSRAGANVVVTSRNQHELDRIERHARRGAGRILSAVADVRNEGSCDAVARFALDNFGRIDALINNAGIALAGFSADFDSNPPKFWTAPGDAWRAIMDTNVLGVFLMAKAVMPAMLKAGYGRILNVSSAPAVMRRSGWSPYGASKAAVESLTVTWAQELGGTGVTTNVVRPGGQVDTEIFPGGGKSESPRPGLLLPGVMNELVVWLVSEASAGFNGRRFSGNLWDSSLPASEAAARAMLPYPEEPFLF
jgi:NAD(P)-dependent dehydrogenase (short-subunit alcohol dehydrogenase family)